MKRLFMLLLLCTAISIAQAQRITRSYHDLPLSKVLEDLNAATGRYDISFVYNDLEDFTVSTSFERLSLSDALTKVVGFYPVRIVRSGEKFFVECVHKTERHLTGTIVDEQGQPIAFANVAVLNPADSTVLSGGVSNEAGHFVVPYETAPLPSKGGKPHILTPIPSRGVAGVGSVMARITYIGYKTVYRLTTDGDLGTVSLHPEAYTLGNVVVKGTVPQYKLTSGGMDVKVEGTLLANMGSALSVIGELPLVSVRDEKIEVLSKGEPEVYINGKKVRDVRTELSSLKSADIKSIEVITNPGAQYNAAVEAVIRIKTIRRTNEGLSVRSVSTVLYNSKWMGQQEAQFSYRQGSLEAFANLTYGSYCKKAKNSLTYDITTPQKQIEVQQNADMYRRNREVNCKAGFSYDISSNQSIGLSYQLNKLLKHTASHDDRQTISENGIRTADITGHETQHRHGGPTHTLDAYYAATLGRLTLNIDGTAFWDKDGMEQDVTEQSTDVESRNVSTESSNRKRLLAGKLVMGYPIGNGQLELGSEVSHTRLHSLYYSNFEQIPSTDNEVREQHLALFAEYGLPLSKTLRVGMGLRYEHVANDYDSFGQRVDENSRAYDQLFPNASIAWQKQKWGVQLSYNQRVKRPAYRALTRHLQYNSRYLYEGGNLQLQPQFNHNIALNAVYAWLNLRAEYTYQDNCIMQLAGLYNDQPICYMWWENVSRMHNLAASVVAAPKFSWYQPQYTLAFWQQRFDAAAYGIDHDMQKPQFMAYLQNRFMLGKKAFVCINLFGSTNYSATIGEQKAQAFADLKFYTPLGAGGWSLNININDLFYSRPERWSSYGNSVQLHKEEWANSRGVIATLTYNFNQQRSKYRGTGAGSDEKSRL